MALTTDAGGSKSHERRDCDGRPVDAGRSNSASHPLATILVTLFLPSGKFPRKWPKKTETAQGGHSHHTFRSARSKARRKTQSFVSLIPALGESKCSFSPKLSDTRFLRDVRQTLTALVGHGIALTHGPDTGLNFRNGNFVLQSRDGASILAHPNVMSSAHGRPCTVVK
jgi:hypothetical protein